MNIFKQVTAFILGFLGWMFILSAVGSIMMGIWLFAAIVATIGAVLLYFCNKLNEPFAWASKVKKLERKWRKADERKAALARRQDQHTDSHNHAADDLSAKLLEREQEKHRKQDKDSK